MNDFPAWFTGSCEQCTAAEEAVASKCEADMTRETVVGRDAGLLEGGVYVES